MLGSLSKNFRIDIIAFSKGYACGDRSVEALIEFKLWTSVDKIRIDIDRLRSLSKAIPPQDRRPEAYVICLPHYRTMERVADALEDLSQRFKLVDVGEAGNLPFPTQDSSDRSNGPAAAVAIINANDSDVMRV
ncbi:MAG: hypothetical protein GC204_09310 [Chloroflexi bacterium]|nr:hypothetical protein [Chloroflexota bacterium]